MKKQYIIPTSREYKIRVSSLICTSPTINDEVKSDTEGQLGREYTGGDLWSAPADDSQEDNSGW